MLLFALACSSPAEPVGPYFDTVPGYPNARKLCSSQRTLANGAVTQVMYATSDDLPTVVAFYQSNHGEGVVQPSGPGLRVRGSAHQMLTIGGVGSEQVTCDVKPAESDHTSLVVSQFSSRP